MSVAILFQYKEIGDWFKNLKALLPDTKIEVYPDIDKSFGLLSLPIKSSCCSP